MMKASWMARLLGLLLAGLLAGCAGSSPLVNPWQDMWLQVVTTYSQERDELKISGVFQVKPPKGFGRDPKKIRGYQDFQISFNGQPFTRQDYNAVLPVGPRLRHAGYEFAGVLPAPGPVVAVVLVARGQSFAFDIPIARFEIGGLPARFDRNDDLVLTYRGPPLAGEQAGKLHGSIWPLVARPDAVLPWSASPEGQKPGDGDRYVITPSDMRRLEAGEVKLLFSIRSQHRFHLHDLEIWVSSVVQAPWLYAEAY